MFPAGLTLIHCLDKGRLLCKDCVTTEESNGLLEKEHSLSIHLSMIKNSSRLCELFWEAKKEVTYMTGTCNSAKLAREIFCLLLYRALNVYRT